MKRLKKHQFHLPLLVLLLSLLPAHASAVGPVYFRTFDSESGLPDRSVNDIAEDEFGVIWLATWNGLARFDGHHMDTYSNVPDNPHSLANNMVRAVLPVSGGVFVAHDAGLDFLDFNSGKFLHCRKCGGDGSTPEAITSRVSRLLCRGGYVFALTVDGDILRQNNVDDHMAFLRMPRPNDRRYADLSSFTGGRIAALSDKGVTILSGNGEREISMTPINLSFDSNLNIFCDSVRGGVYIGRGIGYSSLAFRVADSKGNLSQNPDLQLPGNLMCCRSLPDGGIAFATDGDGVLIGVPGEELIHCNPDNSNISGEVIYSMCADSRGNLWCGTYRRGLSLLSPRLNSYNLYNKENGTLHHDIVTGIRKMGSRMYVALDGGGLDILDMATGKSVNRNSRNSALPGDNITDIMTDGSRVWLTVYSHGLVEYNPATDSFISHPVDELSEPGNKLWTLVDGGRGNIIVGGIRLHSYDKATGRFSNILDGRDLDVTSLVRNGEELLVASRRDGLYVLDSSSFESKGLFSSSPAGCGAAIPYSSVTCVYRDSNDILWLSSGMKELVALNLSQGNTIDKFGVADGLDDVRVESIAEDPEGNLWMGTVSGLYKYIRSRGRFIRISDVRLPKEYTANAAFFIDGNIWIGSTSGLVAIPYSSNFGSDSPLPILFTAIDVLNDPGRSIPLYGRGTPEIDLDNRENFFAVRFSVPETVNPDRVRMQCMLDGFDKMWRDVSLSRTATYTNVPPGDYTVKVRQTDSDGVWGEPVEMSLTVRHPWYLTWWAISIWIILLAGAALLGYHLWSRYRKNVLKTREVERERENSRKLNEAKLDFLAGISHELRTPCFLISAQIEEILDQKRQSVPVASLNGIYRNSQKLNKLISNIIDFRKMESGQLTILPRTMDVGRLLSELAVDYEYLCSQKGLRFSYKAPDTPVVVKGDPDKIEFIVTNLITNAYKYTPKEGGEVTLSLDVTEQDVIIRVSDTGIGIVKEMQSEIFRPFFRTERGAAENYGDGIGLAFVKHLVELHHGTVTVQSEVNVGTVFTVIIPASNDLIEEVETTEKQTSTPPAPRERAPRVATQPISNPTATHSILVVEDEDDLRRLLSNAFGDDYRVTAVATAEDALKLFKTGEFDIVITDIMLPGKDGHEVISAVRGEDANKNVKIIVLSALSSDDDMLRAYQEGADMYLTKPVSLKMLRHHVEHLHTDTDISALLAVPSSHVRKYNHDERQFLLRCRTVIDESLTDEDFSIETLARKLAMSHSSLYKKIKALTGIPVIDFINEYKICKAVMLFRQGSTNVQNVADQCGFRDIKTFRETFKRKMNMPPKQYVQMLAEGKQGGGKPDRS